MKEIFYKLLTYFFGLTIILYALFFLTGSLSANHRLGTTLIKQNRLQKIEEPKVILVGGSSLHYGINSQYLQDRLKMPVINMGIQGSIGLRYMFEEIMDEVGPDDVVLLLAEPGHYYTLDIDGEKTLYRLLSKYPQGIKELTVKQYFNSLYSVGPVIKDNVEYLLSLMTQRLKKMPTIFDNTDQCGDYFGHKGKASIYKPSTQEEEDYKISQKTLSYIEEKKIEIENKKAHFFIDFAPTAESSIDEALLKKIEDELVDLFGRDIILGHPETYVFPDSFFYDTSHHLLYGKRNQRTELLLKDIENSKKAFKY